MSDLEEPQFLLIDEPTSMIMRTLLTNHPEIERLINTPQQILAFRTFAFMRIGVLLKEWTRRDDLAACRRDEKWVETFLADSGHDAAMLSALQAVADEITFDLSSTDTEPLGPDWAARERFRQFAALESRGHGAC